jgi:hypothetical protein
MYTLHLRNGQYEYIDKSGAYVAYPCGPFFDVHSGTVFEQAVAMKLPPSIHDLIVSFLFVWANDHVPHWSIHSRQREHTKDDRKAFESLACDMCCGDDANEEETVEKEEEKENDEEEEEKETEEKKKEEENDEEETVEKEEDMDLCGIEDREIQEELNYITGERQEVDNYVSHESICPDMHCSDDDEEEEGCADLCGREDCEIQKELDYIIRSI